MRERLLGRIGALGVERPYAVLGVAAALAALAAAAIPRIEIASSRFELIAGETSFVDVPGARTDLVALVRASDPARARAATDQLAVELAALDGVQDVLHRVDPELLAEHALFALPASEAEALARASGARSLAALVALAREGLGGREGDTLDTLESAPELGADPAGGLRSLVALLEEATRWQIEPGRDVIELGARAPGPRLDGAGYLVSSDGSTRYVLVTPARATDRYDEVAPLVTRARALGREIAHARGVDIAFTGYPALAVDEVDAIRDGSVRTGVVSGLLVMALFAIAFRSRAGIVLAGAPLGLGMLLAFGAIALVVGELNLLTQAAAPVFAGLGIDFAIHLLAAYDDERRAGTPHAGAIDRAMRGAGKAITTGALTTSGAFFALSLAEHRAFRELGLVAGLGLLVVLAAVLFVTPALTTVGERRGWRWLTLGSGAPRPVGGEAAAFARRVTSRPGPMLAASALVVLALAAGLGRVRFDAEVEALLPAEAPSVVAARRLRADGAYSSEVLVARAPDLDALAATSARLAALPSVAYVESVAPFAHVDTQATLQRLAALPAPRAPAELAPLAPALAAARARRRGPTRRPRSRERPPRRPRSCAASRAPRARSRPRSSPRGSPRSTPPSKRSSRPSPRRSRTRRTARSRRPRSTRSPTRCARGSAATRAATPSTSTRAATCSRPARSTRSCATCAP
ncbi:MAG: MMPL family transporter [Sandaracinaceae bacterium]|nr:MMPL family transporter [Sandaracinaceae bacterium]